MPSCSIFRACAIFSLGYGNIMLVSLGALDNNGFTLVSLFICFPHQFIGDFGALGPPNRPPLYVPIAFSTLIGGKADHSGARTPGPEAVLLEIRRWTSNCASDGVIESILARRGIGKLASADKGRKEA